ncbi:MAG: DegV family protein [Chloroflexi bacterium]|nr:MAG: DegV family protein [Chloroflexota bacterium]MBL1193329.1 DegV family protein [Chloroflexota bacterium]NOH10621.1 DegV family protein [Chloroflexota bacterium]
MLHIVTDSATDMPLAWREQFDIHVIPVNLCIQGKTYKDEIDLDCERFLELVARTRQIPTTAQPAPHDYIELYRSIAKPGDTILSIHLSSKLSGTYASAEMAKQEVGEQLEIVPFDSLSGSAATAFMAREARQLANKGAGLDIILERLAYIRDRVRIAFTLDTLEYAVMSGRIRRLQAAVVSVLQIKPIVEVRNGLIEMTDKVRTRKRATARLIEKMQASFGDQPINVAIIHAWASEAGEALCHQVQRSLNCQEVFIDQLSNGVASHLGPGTVGIVAYPILQNRLRPT